MSSILAALQPFLVGAVAGCTATTCVQPIDYVKTRLQLMGEGTKSGARVSPIGVARSIIAESGFMTLYTGISAAWARQIVYGSCRLGFFRTFSDMLKARNEGKPIPVSQKVIASLAAGGVSSFIGNPTEIALVRMQADGVLPPAERRNYRGIFDAVRRIVKEEGVANLWRGSTPTVLRAMSLNMGMLATADQAKESLGPYLGGEKSGLTLVVSSVISGVTASVTSLPFDMVKTRLQKQKPRPDGTMPYKGFVDCAAQIAAKEGPLAFYKGLSTYIVRIAPHSIITLITLDALNDAFNKHMK